MKTSFPEPLEKVLSQRIREARMNAGYTQQSLADELGCDVATVQSWEVGRHAPHPRALKQVSDVTDTPIWWLRGNDRRPGAERDRSDRRRHRKG